MAPVSVVTNRFHRYRLNRSRIRQRLCIMHPQPILSTPMDNWIHHNISLTMLASICITRIHRPPVGIRQRRKFALLNALGSFLMNKNVPMSHVALMEHKSYPRYRSKILFPFCPAKHIFIVFHLCLNHDLHMSQKYC